MPQIGGQRKTGKADKARERQSTQRLLRAGKLKVILRVYSFFLRLNGPSRRKRHNQGCGQIGISSAVDPEFCPEGPSIECHKKQNGLLRAPEGGSQVSPAPLLQSPAGSSQCSCKTAHQTVECSGDVFWA